MCYIGSVERENYMTNSEKIKTVAKVLKKYFTNLDALKTIDIASEIVEELDK